MIRVLEFLIALGIVAVLFLMVGIALPAHRHILESVETNRKMTIVYDTVNSFARFDDWNPIALRDPGIHIERSGPRSGVGATLTYRSSDNHGTWEIVESVPNQKVVIRVTDSTKGRDKYVTFLLEPTGRNQRNVRITQTYDVDYGKNLLGRFAGLYVQDTVGADMKTGLHRMTEIFTQIPNVDYAADASGLRHLGIVDVPAEDVLVVNAGSIERDDEWIEKSIRDNQEWIRRALADNAALEAAGPLRVITTDFGSERYTFEVAIPVRRKVTIEPPAPAPASGAPPAAEAQPEQNAEPLALTPAAGDILEVKIGEGMPVEYRRTAAHRAAFASYTGHMGGLEAVRTAIRAWALTQGDEVIERPFDVWKNGVDKAFTTDGEFDVYWSIK